MKTLIAYGTKTGASKKCAELLAQELTDATVVDLSKTSPDVSAYDQIVVGGGIRAGRLNSAARKFINKNKAQLQSKRIAFYICNSNTEDFKQYADKNIDAELLKAAVCTDSFGGEINVNNAHGFDKVFVKAIANGIRNGAIPVLTIKPERISAFAEALK